MKLNLHILKEDLNEICVYSHIPDNESLNLIGIQFLQMANTIFTDDILYITTPDIYTHHPFKNQLHSIAMVCSLQEKPDITHKSYLILDPSFSIMELFTKIQSIFDTYNRWEIQLMNLATKTGNLTELLTLGKEVLGNPMALFDSNMTCIAIGGKEEIPADDLVWHDVIQYSHATINLIPFLLNDRKNIARIASEQDAFLYTFPQLQKPCLHCNLFRKRQKIASICMTEIVTPLTKRTISLTNHFRLFILIALEHGNLPLSISPDFEQLVRQYLNGQICDEQYLNFILGKFGWISNDHYQIIVCSSSNPTHDESKTTLHYFQNQLPGCLVLTYDNQVLIVQHLSEKIKKKELPIGLEKLVEKLDYQCGVSSSFSNFQDITQEYKKAVSALLIGRSKFLENKIYYYDELLLDHLIYTLKQYADPLHFCHPDIIKLYKYSLDTNIPYINSLFTYFICGKSLIKSARQLYIHRNTFVYRLNKIEDIIGKESLSNQENILPYLLSCWILFSEHNTRQI